jgi:hypothetical protein
MNVAVFVGAAIGESLPQGQMKAEVGKVTGLVPWSGSSVNTQCPAIPLTGTKAGSIRKN